MVGMIMDNIFEECKSVEDKYGEYMSAIVTLSSTENAMLSKTFCSELKQQRFKYIKDNI
jgi:hypothetical protein